VSTEPATGQADSNEWLRFDTDACGQLGQVEDPDSTLFKRLAGDDTDEGDDDEEDYSWTEVWGMPDEVSSEAERWYLEHPRVAIETDAIKRSCETESSDFDAPDPGDFA
jgi:hypothetical protein